jgi:uracil-DNA glycosylase
VSEATRESIDSIDQFRHLGFYLLPAVRCPSEDAGRDHPPSVAAIRNCERHLLRMLEAICPERIVTLGQAPLRAVSEIFGLPLPRRLSELRSVIQWARLGGDSIPVASTYFAGNNRHRGFGDIVRAIEQVLSTHTERQKA